MNEWSCGAERGRSGLVDGCLPAIDRDRGYRNQENSGSHLFLVIHGMVNGDWISWGDETENSNHSLMTIRMKPTDNDTEPPANCCSYQQAIPWIFH
jgi:hypothetical protein